MNTVCDFYFLNFCAYAIMCVLYTSFDLNTFTFLLQFSFATLSALNYLVIF